MAIDNNTKQAVKAKLRLGSTPKDVAEQFGIGIQTIYAIQRTVQNDKDSELATDLHDIPTEIVAHVVEEAKKEIHLPTPGGKAPMIEAFNAVSAGAEGLKKLDMSFQTTVTNALNKFNKFLLDEHTPLKDIKLILDTTANAYEKVFNSGTNIHIGDNNSQSNQNLTVFKTKQGV